MKEQRKTSEGDSALQNRNQQNILKFGLIALAVMIVLGTLFFIIKKKTVPSNTDEQFKILVHEAETFVNAQKLDSALIKYKQAYKISQDENVKNSIDEIQNQLDIDNEISSDEENTDAEQPNQEKYIRFIADGEKYLEKKDYVKAIRSFKKALKLNKTNKELEDRIESIKELQRESRKKNADKHRVNEITLIEYNQYIKKGDIYYKEGKYSEAIIEYNKAKEIAPSRKEHVRKINETKQKLKN